MQSLIYDAIKTQEKASQKISDALVVEAALQIDINGQAYTVVMRTPNDDKALIRGLLYAEDIYKFKDAPHIETLEYHDNGFSKVNVQIEQSKLGKGYLNKRNLLSVSSCGVCGKQNLDALKVEGEAIGKAKRIKMGSIKAMYQKMMVQQALFINTGGSHATAAFDQHNELICLKEDIGRHNALDKVVGQLLIENNLDQVECIIVSGRVSYEIVTKAFIAKIPMIIAISACSSLAVDFAKEFGIGLIGFSRDDNATIYANPQYLEM